MPTGGPFPTKDSEFNTYIQTAIAWLVSNKARLGVSDDNKNECRKGR